MSLLANVVNVDIHSDSSMLLAYKVINFLCINAFCDRRADPSL